MKIKSKTVKLNYLHISYILFTIISLLPFKNFGQNDVMYSINASGNDISGNSGVIAYSIGQAFFSNFKNNNYQITEGIQQSNKEDTEVNNNNEDIDDDLLSPIIKIAVYPNPTTNFVTLAFEGIELDNPLNSYQLYNYQGKLLKQDFIQLTTTQIDLSNLSSSIYLLQVFVKEKLWKTFKILKQ